MEFLSSSYNYRRLFYCLLYSWVNVSFIPFLEIIQMIVTFLLVSQEMNEWPTVNNSGRIDFGSPINLIVLHSVIRETLEASNWGPIEWVVTIVTNKSLSTSENKN